MKQEYEVIVVGAGLAGLACALELTLKGKKVLVLEGEKVIGGRTSSYEIDGMKVESGFHRYIGFYSHLPEILRKAGVKLNDILTWEEKIHIRVDDQDPIVFGLAPFFGPGKTIKGVLANQEHLSAKDKASLIPFFLNGFKDYAADPHELDKFSIKEYAEKHGVTDKAFHYVVVPLSTGVFFLPPDRYSACVFFGLFAPGIPKFLKMRIGAYLGGMTEVMCQPIADCITNNGGTVLVESKVNSLVFEDSKIQGVVLENGQTYFADHIVVATTLNAAKQLLKPHFEHDKWFVPMSQLSLMPAVSFQIELTEPALPVDITTFAPFTCITSFAEQSRTTFQESEGRLSLILSPPEKFLEMPPEETLKIVVEDAKKIGLHLEGKIKDYRQVNHVYDFHSLEPGNQHLRPLQKTPVDGLVLAGDYTKQPYFATMEGAVYSGMEAAKLID